MFERFTDRARRVLVVAQEEARLLNHSFIGTEHILLALLTEEEGLAAKALTSLEVSLEAVREKVRETIGPAGNAPTGSPPFTPRAKKVLELSLREALQRGHNYIGTEHILLGIVREGEREAGGGVACTVLENLGATSERILETVDDMLGEKTPQETEPRFVGARLPLEQMPRRTLSAIGFQWPNFPNRVVAGSTSPLINDGVSLGIFGLLLHDAGVEMICQRSGPPPPPRPEQLLLLADDLGNEYKAMNFQFEPRPENRFIGRTFFMLEVPAEARVLRISRLAASIELSLE